MRRSIIILSTGLVALACCAVALAGGVVHYKAGIGGNPPYAFFTVSGGKVTTVRWAVSLACPNSGYPSGEELAAGPTLVNARIRKNGRFSKDVPVGDNGGVTFSGRISGPKATMTIDATEVDQTNNA